MFLSMVSFGQNYGNFQSAGSSGNVSLGATINSFTKFYINTPNQNGAYFRVTGNNKTGLRILTYGSNSKALKIDASCGNCYGAYINGKTYISSNLGLGIDPLTTAAHEKLAVRNGMITINGIGNGLHFDGSSYGSANDFGTQRYGLYLGDGALVNLSTAQTNGHRPMVLSNFWGLAFDVNGGKMAMCQNGAIYIGGKDASTINEIESLADKDTWDVTYRLYVEKGVCTEKVKVTDVNNFPDFVFEEDYNLRSLTEVEAYITQNKHLPNVPSAAEVEKDGLDLGEMDKILLQKIEELTLYTIEQQKQIEALKKELETLKK